MEGKETGETRRNANTAVSAADSVLPSVTQIESWTFPTSWRRSKLLTLLTMEARLGVSSESSSRCRAGDEVESSSDYASLFLAAGI